MIDAEKIRAALLNNQGLIRAAQRDWQAAYTIQKALLNAIGVQSSDAVIQKLRENGYDGLCWPTAELDQHHSLFINLFPEDFSNSDALQWAEKTLEGTSTFAVHSAFIPPKKGSIPPIGAINIGWAYHPRQAGQKKMAGLDLKILIGDDFVGPIQPIRSRIYTTDRRTSVHCENDQDSGNNGDECQIGHHLFF